MVLRPLGRTGLHVSPIGYGAFKIGRNVGIKYDRPYELPGEETVERLLNGVLDLGINLIDTAPAYGLSEQRIGRAIGVRRDEYVLATKVGETFENGHSTYDFSATSIRASVDRSLERLRTDALDILLIHSPGDDLKVLDDTDAVETLESMKSAGLVRAVGLSGRTIAGAEHALGWADVIMVEFHIDDPSHESVICSAVAAGVGVIVKKGLSSGRLPADRAVRFVLGNPAVSSLVVGSLDLDHVRANLAMAETVKV